MSVDKPIASSTEVVRVVADAGPAYLKALNNPIGPNALVRDWVATKLAAWFGLPTLDCAILDIDANADVIRLHSGRVAASGPAFVTRAIEGDSWGGTADELAHVENTDLLTRLVVFDTWVRNVDRYPPQDMPWHVNTDNVLLTREGASTGYLRFVAFDHTECFVGTGSELVGTLATREPVEDSRVYGLFPAFTDFLTEEALSASLVQLEGLRRPTVSSIVNGMPREWWDGVTRGGDQLVDPIVQRSAYVASTISRRVREQCGRLLL